MINLNELESGVLLISVNSSHIYGDKFLDKAINKYPQIKKVYDRTKFNVGDYIKIEVKDLTIVLVANHRQYGDTSCIIDYKQVANTLIAIKEDLQTNYIYAPYTYSCNSENKGDCPIIHALLGHIFNYELVRVN